MQAKMTEKWELKIGLHVMERNLELLLVFKHAKFHGMTGSIFMKQNLLGGDKIHGCYLLDDLCYLILLGYVLGFFIKTYEVDVFVHAA